MQKFQQVIIQIFAKIGPMFQNFQKVVNLISQTLESELVEKFKSGIFADLDPIFEKSLFVFYLIGYNFYEIEVKSMI